MLVRKKAQKAICFFQMILLGFLLAPSVGVASSQVQASFNLNVAPTSVNF
jgi:hypothetical protein